MKNTLISLTIVLLVVVSACCNKGEKEYTQDITTYVSRSGTDVFKPDSASIAQNYEIPEWFKDAKMFLKGPHLLLKQSLTMRSTTV